MPVCLTFYLRWESQSYVDSDRASPLQVIRYRRAVLDAKPGKQDTTHMGIEATETRVKVHTWLVGHSTEVGPRRTSPNDRLSRGFTMCNFDILGLMHHIRRRLQKHARECDLSVIGPAFGPCRPCSTVVVGEKMRLISHRPTSIPDRFIGHVHNVFAKPTLPDKPTNCF